MVSKFLNTYQNQQDYGLLTVRLRKFEFSFSGVYSFCSAISKEYPFLGLRLHVLSLLWDLSLKCSRSALDGVFLLGNYVLYTLKGCSQNLTQLIYVPNRIDIARSCSIKSNVKLHRLLTILSSDFPLHVQNI